MHHPKSCRKLGPIRGFSKSCRVGPGVERNRRQSALIASTLRETAKGMNELMRLMIPQYPVHFLSHQSLSVLQLISNPASQFWHFFL